MKSLTVKRLSIYCETHYIDRNVLLGDSEGELYQVEYERLNALEYENGLIRVADLCTNDRFFADRESLLLWKPYNGRLTMVASVKEDNVTFTASPARLLDSIARSIEQFGADSVPEKYKDLLAPLLQAITQLRSELDRLGATSILVVPDEEASEELRIEETTGCYCYSDHINFELTLANWQQLPDHAGSKAAWGQLVDSGRPILRGLN